MPKRVTSEPGDGSQANKIPREPTRSSPRFANKKTTPQPEPVAKKTTTKKQASEKPKTKKAKGKKDDGPAQNGDTKTNEVTETTEEATEEKA
ncbi:high mobility group nucleosome-binding domain-containing protein 3 [Thalassophryne amazonica]|uniref:high mobility group nucleosome-binding domain-containing protein 3 n=1 Tax=Thalassophryne amazonica TaxID=390379 RepID=UPI0014714C87|nr:high mobility group nucleosome-binding domain-containing protein 3 [Thalassophryne amazonica]